MDKREIINIVRNYKKILTSYFDVDKVILFGSYANNTFSEDSDIDVAVVVNSIEGDYFTYTPLLWKLRRQIDVRIEPILFENGKDESGFLESILQNGIEITD